MDPSALGNVKMPVKFVKRGRPKGCQKSLNVRFATKQNNHGNSGTAEGTDIVHAGV